MASTKPFMRFRGIFDAFLPALLLALALAAAGCALQQADENPAAEGFNSAGSDPRAIALADEVMLAMGGRKAWDDTRFISWDFFGARTLLWDKHTGWVKIETPKDSLTVAVNINTGEGRAVKAGNPVTQPDSLAKYLEQGKRAWINDAYWLVMPFKLKDSGVTLTWLRTATTQDGHAATVLGLTFDNVGVTPQNRYEVYVDDEKKLVTQWAFFPTAMLDTPRFITPWAGYEKHGGILLAGGRGERALTAIQVLDSVPEGTFLLEN